MKKIIILGSLLIGGFLFSQVEIPKSSLKGSITTTTDLNINYTNLVYEKGRVTFTNTKTGKKEFLYDNSVKSINYDAASVTANNTPNLAATVRNSEQADLSGKTSSLNNDFLTDADYVKAKKPSQLGTGFLVGGGACFLVGGILNLSAGSSKVVNSMDQVESQGSPIPLIIGLAGMGAGLVMKISGNSQMKRIKNHSALNFETTKEYFAVTNGNGLEIKMKF